MKNVYVRGNSFLWFENTYFGMEHLLIIFFNSTF